MAIIKGKQLTGSLKVGNVTGSITSTASFGRLTLVDSGSAIDSVGTSSLSTIYADGGVGIGTTQLNGESLRVVGDIGATGNLQVSGNIETSGSIIAREFRTEFVNSSIIFSSGSTQFGDTQDDVHRFTGSIESSGSFELSREPVKGFNYLARASEGQVIAPGSAHTFTALAASKTSNHPYHDSGSGNGYVIDGVETPFLYLTEGYYKFDYSGASSHPIRFYFDAAKTTQYDPSSHVSVAGNVITLKIDKDSPQILYYQCSSHQFMGWAIHTGQNSQGQDESGLRTLVSSSAQLASDISGSFRGELSASFAKFVGGGVSGSLISTSSFGSLVVSGQSTLGTTTLGATTATSLDADGGVTIDNITIDGTEIDLSSGNLTIDVAGNIELNADGGSVDVKDDDAVLLNVSSTKVSGSLLSTGSFGNVKINGSGSTLELIGDVSSSLISTASFGAANVTNVNATELYGTIKTAAQNSITSATGLVTLGSSLNALISGSAVVNAANVSGSSTSTGSFGKLNLVGSASAIEMIGNVSSSLISSASFGALNITNVNATELYGTIKTATQNSITSATGLVTLGSDLNTLISGSAVVNAANVSGSLTSTGSFGTVKLLGSGSSIEAIGNVSSSLISTASFGSVNVTNVNAVGGELTNITTLTAGGDLDIGAHGFRANTLTADAQTSGRVAIYGSNGLLTEDSDLSFSGNTLTATNINAGNISGSLISTGSFGNVKINGSGSSLELIGDVSSSLISSASFGTLNTTNVNATDVTATDLVSTTLTTTTINATGDISTSGSVFAREFHTEFTSASVVFASGSNKFGDTLDDVHRFTGSIEVTGSLLSVTPVGGVSGSLTSTASFGSIVTPGAVSVGSLDADGGVTIDNITIDGTEIDLSSGNLTIDVDGDVEINADGGDVNIKDDGASLLNISSTKVSGSLTSTGSFGRIILAGSSSLPAIEMIGNVSSSLISSASFGAVNATNINSTEVYGTIKTAAQNSITSATGLVTLGSSLNTLISGSAVVNAADVSGSITSTGSFGKLILVNSASAIEMIGHITGSSLSSASFARGNFGTLSGVIIDGALDVNGSQTISGNLTADHASNDFQIVSTNARVKVEETIFSGSDVTIAGNLTVVGTTTNNTVAGLDVEAATITVSSGSTSSSDIDGSGILFGDGGTVANIKYRHTGTTITSSVDFEAPAAKFDGGVTIDNITIDGTEIDLSSGDLTVDVAGDIELNADGGDVIVKDDGDILANISATKISGSISSTGSFGRAIINDSGSKALEIVGNLTSSLISTGSFGKVTSTDLFGTIQTATQNSITSATGLVTLGSALNTLISGSAVVNAANVSGSLLSTGSFGNVKINGSGSTLELIGDVSSSLISTASFGTLNVTNVNAVGGTLSNIVTLTAGGNLDIGAHGFRANTLTADNQTSGRVAIYGSNGLLSEDSDLTFSGATLTATNISSTTIQAGNVSGSITSTGSFGSLVVADKVQGTLNLTDLDLTGNLEVGGNISTSGSITAREFHTEFVSASIIFASGSTKLGDTQDDIHRFTGSIESTGSLTITSASLKVDSQGNNEIVGGLYLSSASGSFSGSFTGSGFATVDDATALAIALG